MEIDIRSYENDKNFQLADYFQLNEDNVLERADRI